MKSAWAAAAIGASLILAACGGGGGDGYDGPDAPPSIITHILSDPTADGDIEETGPDSYTVTQGMSADVQTVLAGIDPVSQTEFRAFLNFPLTGPDGVPGNARIESAYLEIFIDDVQPLGGRIPLLIDLVEFQPPELIGSDFDRGALPALQSVRTSGTVSSSDAGRYLAIDVTPLMIEAQHSQQSDLQLRILEDLGPPTDTLISIDDTTGPGRSSHAPLLTVTYY